jgi:hypothetical protein
MEILNGRWTLNKKQYKDLSIVGQEYFRQYFIAAKINPLKKN